MSVIPLDQASELRELVRARALPEAAARTAQAAPRAARVVAIASGKGGVGKTNIAVSLSIRLAERGAKVTLIDADLGTANVDVVMNVRSRFDLSHVIHGERSVRDVAHEVSENLSLVIGASGLADIADLGAFERTRLLEELAIVERESDFVLFDCGAGISQNVLVFAHSADELLVVTTPEPAAMTDAYALIKAMSRAPEPPPMRLLVNQAASPAEGVRIGDRVSNVAAKFLGVALGPSGTILYDKCVREAVRQRLPFISKYPRCAAASGISVLAERMLRERAILKPRPGFFRRMFRFF